MSHQEVSFKWKQTNHTDPYQYFKDNGKTIDEFRSAVQQEINRQLGGDKMDVKQAIDILVQKGIISSPDYWLKAIDVVKYLDSLLINVASKL